MVEIHTLAVFIPAVIAVALLPGPSNLLVMSRSLSGGKHLGLATVLGGALGTGIQMVVAALGLATLLTTSTLAFSVLKYLGAAYLIFLGVRSLLERQALHSALESKSISLEEAFSQALLTDLLNPKAALFYAAFLPQFITGNTGTNASQFLILGFIAVLVFTLNNLFIVFLTNSLKGWLTRTPSFQRWQARVTGCVFIGLGLRLAVSNRD